MHHVAESERTMRKAIPLIGALAALTLGGLPLAAPAGAGDPVPVGPELFVEPLYILAQPTFAFELDPSVCTDPATVDVVGVAGEVIDLDTDDSGTITLPAGTAGGFYPVTLDCPGEGAPIEADGELAFGVVTVEKVVEGDAPDDAEFPIEVSCDGGLEPAADGDPTIDATLVFGAAGGAQQLVHYTGQECTISELDDGGATSSSITTEDCGGGEMGVSAVGPSGEFGIFFAADRTQTVTNVFPAAVGPTDETPPPATAPTPVAADPTFTG
jgi:hypothetical protein